VGTLSSSGPSGIPGDAQGDLIEFFLKPRRQRGLVGMAKPIKGDPAHWHATRWINGKNMYAYSCPTSCPCRQSKKKMSGHALFGSQEAAKKAYREQLAHLY
jgi:hypothetical protein